jgi:nuclear pore complex protein Nup205
VEASDPEFMLSNASVAYIDYLGARAMIFEYIAQELCSVTQNRIPAIKRQIFDALNGQIKLDGDEPLTLPNVFDFFDFVNADPNLDIPTPEFVFYKDLNLRPCAVEHPDAGLQYDVRKVRETIALKRNEFRDTLQVAPQQQLDAIEKEEGLLIEYLTFTNRQKLLGASRATLLGSWANLLLVMFEANDLKGTPKMAFLLQALQAILPTLEAYSTLSPAEAFELARVAKVLLFKLDFDFDDDDTVSGLGKEKFTVGNLISDKLFQLFQVCLNSIGKWAGSAELRALYYGICYRYLTAVVDRDTAASHNRSTRSLVTARTRTLKAIQIHGDRLLNVICDDAYGSDTACQTAAMILLSALVHTSRSTDEDIPIVESLNRLNFIGVFVDSLKTILSDWLAVVPASLRGRTTTNLLFNHNRKAEAFSAEQDAAADAERYLTAKLALLLQIAQTRQGAKYVLQAGLFRALELAGVFAADPELEVDAEDIRALEKHYSLLVALARIVGAAVLARGAHNVVQGRRFLTQHRMLVVHTLKRSAGIGIVGSGGLQHQDVLRSRVRDAEEQAVLQERVEELAEAFMLLIAATGFLEVCLPPFPFPFLSFLFFGLYFWGWFEVVA